VAVKGSLLLSLGDGPTIMRWFHLIANGLLAAANIVFAIETVCVTFLKTSAHTPLGLLVAIIYILGWRQAGTCSRYFAA
jgi:hypothetical protein